MRFRSVTSEQGVPVRNEDVGCHSGSSIVIRLNLIDSGTETMSQPYLNDDAFAADPWEGKRKDGAMTEVKK